MFVSANEGSTLTELARAIAAGGNHSIAVALRTLAREGYATLQQVESTPDWILLSIRGIGVGRLGEVRRLSRPDWEPPSSQAIQAGSWFLSAARFALHHWSPEALTLLIQGSAPPKVNGGPVEKQLALDIFFRAARTARWHCEPRELIQALRQAQRSYAQVTPFAPESCSGSDVPLPALDSIRTVTPAPESPPILPDEDDAVQDSDHFAHSRQKRLEIVRNYWVARDRGDIENKDAWARSQYHICGKTLLCYEREFADQRQAILAAADGERARP